MEDKGLRATLTEAQALLNGDRDALARVAARILKPLRNNFVERPWGGTRIREFKRLAPLPDQRAATGMGLGEAFEIAAYDQDPEARQYPSRLRFEDGSEISLAGLLRHCAVEVLGSEFAERFGPFMPLLPKTLNIKELLSVQGHPEGHTEVYIIIEAEPGATIRLGFREAMDPDLFKKELIEGRRQQATVLSLLGEAQDPGELQAVVAPWLARREVGVEGIASFIRGADPHRDEILRLLAALKSLYWRVLDSMNAIPVSAGQVIYNANPARIVAATGRSPSAEVHALGNPEGKEILALEIRRPGPTFRAWDNVRFPIREVDVHAAIDALNLNGTKADEYLVVPTPVAGCTGVLCSVDSASFRVEHLRPKPSSPVDVPAEPPHCLLAIRGRARFLNREGLTIGDLDRGESAVVPIGVSAYRVECADADTEIIKVSLPVSA